MMKFNMLCPWSRKVTSGSSMRQVFEFVHEEYFSECCLNLLDFPQGYPIHMCLASFGISRKRTQEQEFKSTKELQSDISVQC